ncbi:MFS transporter [Methylopila sp. 73B]|uniref:MFS transporter n=1 Tax=Methylopila sp. 73B TaxID=1120792 RepID=UPI00037F7B51|nr:MFS transporter [Methylopila sp. 73B]
MDGPHAAAEAPIDDRRRRQIIVGVLTAMLLAALDQTIVAPAMTTIGETLGHAEYLPWIVSAYLVTATAVTPLYGKLADVYGRHPVIIAAVSIFMAASVVCALAPNLPVLIVGRALQGLGGGGLMALAQTVIGDIVPPKQRGNYAAYISGMWAVSGVAGPIVGGAFAEHLHWSLIFWVNIPLGLAALFVMNAPLRDLPFRPKSHRLDVAGAGLVVAATSLAMLALSIGRTGGDWTSPAVLGLAAAAAVGAVLFAIRLWTFAEPLIPLGVLKDPVVAFGVATVFFGVLGHLGLSTLVPIYFETIAGFRPDVAALGLVGLAIGTVLGAMTAARFLVKARRYKAPALAGLSLAIVMLAALAATLDLRSFWLAEALLCVYGFGIGTMFPTTTVSVQNAVGRHDLGAATALLAFMRSLGSAAGVAILGAAVLGAGLGPEEGGAAARGVAIDPTNFRVAFLIAIGTTAVALACLVAMPRRPLRDTLDPVSVES